MALLSNMSIERTIGHMSSSSGAGGYRYLGGEGITVDNDLYKISVDYNPETLTIDANSKLAFNYSFLQSGDNISMNYEDGHLVISAATFQSQFEDGDKVKYDQACLNLAQAMLDIITINGDITTIQGNITAINGENGSIAGLDSRIDTLESHDTDYSSRIGTLESHDTDHETRLSAAEGTILAQTGTISDNDTRSRANAQSIETINQTIETLTGYSGDIGNLAERVTTAEGNISTNADNIAANLLLIQGNATDIAAINTAIDTPDTGYAARIADVENTAATNYSLITALNTRVNALDPSGAEPGESLPERMTAAEGRLDGHDSDLSNLETSIGSVGDVADQAASDISDLSTAYNSYTSATDNRLDALELFQTSAEGSLDDLGAADTALSDRIDVLEGLTISSRLTDLESFQSSATSTIGDNSSAIGALQSTVGNHTTSLNQIGPQITALQNAMDDKADLLDTFYYLAAPEAEYTAVQNSDSYDPSYSYFFADPVVYSQYYPVPIYVDYENDSYDNSITYYTYDDQNDQYSAYTYVDAETFATDAENGLIYFEYPSGTQLYESDGGTGYTVFNGSVDPSGTYYVQNPTAYSDQYIPEISRVASGESYDSSKTYYTIDLRGNMNTYTYVDSATFDADIVTGLFYVSNWSAAITEGLYKQSYSGVSSVFTIPTSASGIAFVESGTGNKLSINIEGNTITTIAASGANNNISFAFSANDFVECSVTPANNGTGVRGAVYVKYFGDAQLVDQGEP